MYPGIPMYLTKRENGYRFQRRIPKNLESLLGSSPIRLHLGHLSTTKAKLASRLLVGHLDRLLLDLSKRGGSSMNSDVDPRDAIIAEMQAQIDELMEGSRQIAEITDEVMGQQERAHAAELDQQANQLKADALERENGLRREVNAAYLSYLETQATVLETLQRAKARNIPSPPEAIQPQLEALFAKVESLSDSVAMSLDGGPPRALFSDALEEWHKMRGGLGIDPKKVDMDYARMKDFMAYAGDRPVNKYRFFDIQNFANLLARLPASYSTKAIFRTMSRQEAADYNANLPAAKQDKPLAGKTIEAGYLSPLTLFFKDMAAEHQFASPLAGINVRISANASESIDRVPFTVKELNKWFAHAATEDRGDMKWLPLLGSLTGARIGELIGLQKKDVYQVDSGHWVIDLTTNIIDESGLEVARRIKNKSSRRIIAIHQAIVDAGFIDYAMSFPDGSIFPWAFRYGKAIVKRPADAASKRVNNQLKKVGIHKEIESTFHSTRHTAKDIMRVAKVDQRTHNLQTGHAQATESDKYGSKRLKTDELEVLAALPLPEGLDLSPFQKQSA